MSDRYETLRKLAESQWETFAASDGNLSVRELESKLTDADREALRALLEERDELAANVKPANQVLEFFTEDIRERMRERSDKAQARMRVIEAAKAWRGAKERDQSLAAMHDLDAAVDALAAMEMKQ